MPDTKDLTENEKRALEEYATSPGWYEYPGVDKALRKQELLDMLDGDEFVDEDGEPKGKIPPKPKPLKDGDQFDPDKILEYEAALDAHETAKLQPKLAKDRKRTERSFGEPNPPSPEPEKFGAIKRPDPVATSVEPDSMVSIEVPVVEPGSRNHAVLAVRALLTLHGWPTNARKNLWDADLERAVFEFQQARRIPADGVVNAKTWAALLDHTHVTA